MNEYARLADLADGGDNVKRMLQQLEAEVDGAVAGARGAPQAFRERLTGKHQLLLAMHEKELLARDAGAAAISQVKFLIARNDARAAARGRARARATPRSRARVRARLARARARRAARPAPTPAGAVAAARVQRWWRLWRARAACSAARGAFAAAQQLRAALMMQAWYRQGAQQQQRIRSRARARRR